MAYEYSDVTHEDYEWCKKKSESILSDVALSYHISQEQIRYNHVINYLANNYSPCELLCFSKKPTLISEKYPELNRFNNLLHSIGLDLTCSDIHYEKDSFVKTVDGITLFVEKNPIIFLNASSNQFYPHVIFTIIHEFIHVFDSFNDAKYMAAAALIGNAKACNSKYPDDLQPIENKTNVNASLLYIPSCSLSKNILEQSFSELCSTYTASWAAMHNRLYNYLFYERNWNKWEAKNAVFAFRNSDLDSIRNIRERILSENSIMSFDDLPF